MSLRPSAENYGEVLLAQSADILVRQNRMQHEADKKQQKHHRDDKQSKETKYVAVLFHN